MEKQIYSSKFFKDLRNSSLESAREIVPLIIKLTNPKKVVDVGCGVGSWLSVFQENGVKEILGIDGDYVDKKLLLIPKEKFLAYDLKKPLKINKKFDLIISVEVAEHLPEKCAKTFVNSLTNLGNVIVFSSAIPFQGGTNHINEQFPEYWVELFKKKEYVLIDCIRKRIWNNKKVSYFYAQNILMFIKKDYLKTSKILKEELKNNNLNQLSIVHPTRYLMIAKDRYLITKLIPKPIKLLIGKLKKWSK